MEHVILAQLTGAILLVATPVALRAGLPTTEPFSRFFQSLRQAFRVERRPRRAARRRVMRGARPWWEG